MGLFLRAGSRELWAAMGSTPVAAASQGGATRAEYKHRCQQIEDVESLVVDDTLPSLDSCWATPWGRWTPWAENSSDRSCMAALRRRWAGILGSPGRHFSSLTAAANLPAATSSNGANPDCPTAARVLRSPNG